MAPLVTPEPDDRKPTVWLNSDNIPCYTASSLGGCIRALVAARSGYDPVAPAKRLQAVFDAGHAAEDECLETLKKNGWQLWGKAQTEVKLLIHLRDGKYAFVTGHIDEMGTPPSGPDGIVEVKSQGPTSWEHFERHGPTSPLWEKYAWQISVYMLYFSKPAYWVRWRRPKLDAQGEPDIPEPLWGVEALTSPPHTLLDIAQRVQEVEDWAAQSDFPPCSITQEWNCPFRYLHGDEEDAEPILELPGLESLAAEYDAARLLETEARDRKDKARSLIMEHLEANGYNTSVKVRDGNSLIVVTRGIQRSYLNEKAISKALADAGVDSDLKRFRELGKESSRIEVRVPK